MRFFLSLPLALVAVASVSLAGRAQLVASYDMDSLTVGSSVTFVSDTSGSGHNLTSFFPDNFPTAQNTLSAFNGHTYVQFGNNMALDTSALFTGSGDRTMAAVYALPASDTNGAVNPIIGEANSDQTQGTWFQLQARSGGATGDPYLAGFNADTTSGNLPAPDRLTFVVATYSNANTLESLYWAYGLNGTMQSASSVHALNTVSYGSFLVGADFGGEPSLGNMDVGNIAVYDNALSSQGAQSLITNLQSFYTDPVPEPGTWLMLVAGSMALLVTGRLARASRV